MYSYVGTAAQVSMDSAFHSLPETYTFVCVYVCGKKENAEFMDTSACVCLHLSSFLNKTNECMYVYTYTYICVCELRYSYVGLAAQVSMASAIHFLREACTYDQTNKQTNKQTNQQTHKLTN